MTTLDDLMTLTERLFQHLDSITKLSADKFTSLRRPSIDFSGPFPRLEFIPTLEGAIRAQHNRAWTFPDLAGDNSKAQAKLLEACIAAGIVVPTPATLPRLLDALASHFIEPLCALPTFITHHPECMSPLAKSFVREPPSTSTEASVEATSIPGIRHRVSARAELFIAGREYVNCYEEENSPLVQRRKFAEQLELRNAGDEEAHGIVDESYIQTLEWGMPPTGGWGCGVDRIVMLFGGKGRIADVLPFGNLRHVVGLGRMQGMLEKDVREDKVQDVDRGDPDSIVRDEGVEADFEKQKAARRKMEQEKLAVKTKREEKMASVQERSRKKSEAWPQEVKMLSLEEFEEPEEVPRVNDVLAVADLDDFMDIRPVRKKPNIDEDDVLPQKQEVRTKLGEGRVLSFKDMVASIPEDKKPE